MALKAGLWTFVILITTEVVQAGQSPIKVNDDLLRDADIVIFRTIMAHCLNSSKACIERTNISRKSKKRALFLIRTSGYSVHPYLGLHDHDAFGSGVY